MRTTLISALLMLCNLLFAQSTCEVWQWKGSDSVNKVLAKTQTFNSNGSIVFERVTGFVDNPRYGGSDEEIINLYSDTFLTSKTIALPSRDSFRFEMSYDSAGRMVHWSSYRKDYVIDDTVKSGMFTIDIVDVDTILGKWRFLSEIRMTYDRWGRKVLDEQRSSDHSWQPSSKWEYDQMGRTKRYEYYVDGQLYRFSTFNYYAGGYSCDYSYCVDGKVIRKPGKDSPRYMHKKTSKQKLDDKGRIVEECNLDHKGRQIDRRIISYDVQGRILGEVYFDAADTVALTHCYVYK